MNEDVIIATDDFVAVIDGATSKSKKKFSESESNGRLAAILTMNVVRQLPRETSCDKFCLMATDVIRAIYLNAGIYERVKTYAEERLTASVVVYSRFRNEIWMVGDCQALVNGITYNHPKPTDARLAAKRANYIHQRLSEGGDPADFTVHDSGRDIILQELVDSCSLQNPDSPQKDAFSVVDGFDINMSLVRIIPLPDDVKEIVLASDGYPVLASTLCKTECLLHELLNADPLCIGKFKSTKGKMQGAKSFDDRSYIRIKR